MPGSAIHRAVAVLALALAAGGPWAPVQAAGAWFAVGQAKTQIRANAGALLGNTASSIQQRQRAQRQLQQSVENLGRTASAISAQVAAQNAARAAAAGQGGAVPDGLAEGGLKLAAGAADDALAPKTILDPALWQNAALPVQRSQDGRTVVSIKQTADKAILNWESFNIGRYTSVAFDQSGGSPNHDPEHPSAWAVLNRIKPGAAPSRVQGAITAQGTVMVVNQNGVIFSGASQVDARNLVAAAANITDAQFSANGVYGASATSPSFTDAVAGGVSVEAGARIATREPPSGADGGYVLLLGREVSNAGTITTHKGQTQLAAGNSFIIRRGNGADANQYSTTRGNEIAPQFDADGVDGDPAPNPAGGVRNIGLIVAREGDITLAGRDVRQDGVAVSTTTVNTRGTIHLLGSANDAASKVALGAGAVTAIVAGDVSIGGDGRVALGDDGRTAPDSQRDARVKESAALDQQRLDAAGPNFDNLSTLADRRDQSRIEIVGGSTVDFAGGSLTLATGGQLAVSAGNSMAGTKEGTAAAVHGKVRLDGGARLDVAGSVGVQVAMERNNILVNVSGDAPANRAVGRLGASLWVDRRTLVYAPADTSGYESGRWYTPGGLLEVSGPLGSQGHTIGEWTAQGGTVSLATDDVITRPGSRINFSGGTLDVRGGWINLTWLRGSDGRLYTAGNARADMAHTGLYEGYEDVHERWGEASTRHFHSPLIGQRQRYEPGYTVGRDAGQLLIWSANARLEGELDAEVYNSPRQTGERPATVADAYDFSHTQAALAGRVTIQTYDPTLRSDGNSPRLRRVAPVRLDNTPPASGGTAGNLFWLSLDRVNAAALGGLRIDTLGELAIGADLALAPGGALDVESAGITLGGSLTARGGSVRIKGALGAAGDVHGLTLADGITIDTRGLSTNVALDPAGAWGIAFRNGGSVTLDVHGVLALNAGSRIDASAGRAVLADGSILGGAGGDVTLNAGGPLSDGGSEIATHGYTRDGRLSITTPAVMSIGGTPFRASGSLARGNIALFDTMAGEEFTLPVGGVNQERSNASSIPLAGMSNVGALVSASAAAARAGATAREAMSRARASARNALPSVVSVQILGFGVATAGGAPPPPPPPPAAAGGPAPPVGYDPGSAIQLLGNGPLDARRRGRLTEAERRNLAP